MSRRDIKGEAYTKLAELRILAGVKTPVWATAHGSPACDFRLRPGCAAEDAGLMLPKINVGYTGRAPDLGAYEIGRSLPHYGPRPEC